MQRFYIPAIVIGAIATTILVQPQISFGNSQVNQRAKEFTVKIDGQDRGTGVIISRSGNNYTVLTNWHVVEKVGKYTITTSDGQTHNTDYQQVKRLAGADLALVYFSSDKSYPTTVLGDSDSLTEGSDIYIAGYPAPQEIDTNRAYRFYSDKIVSFLQGNDIKDGYELTYSQGFLPGMSGSPLLNDKGELIGINGKGFTEGNTLTQSVLGIPINTVKKLAARNGISFNTNVADNNSSNSSSNNNRTDDPPDSNINSATTIPETTPVVINTPTAQPTTTSTKLPENNQGSENADFYFDRGVDYYESKQYELALADFNQAIKINPDYALAYYNRGGVYGYLEQYEQALADFNQAIKINPDYVDAYNNRGLVYQKQKNYSQALIDYEQSLKIDPKSYVSIANIGLIKYEQGDKQTALKQWQKALEIVPDSAEMQLAIAVYYYSEGQKDKGISMVKAALKIDPQFTKVEYLEKNLWGDKLIEDARVVLSIVSNQ